MKNAMTTIDTRNAGAVLAAPDFAEILNRWITYVDASPRTVAAYTKAIRYFMAWMAAQGIRQPTRADVTAYRDELKAQGVKPTTIQMYMGAVKRFFKWAAIEGIYINIADGVKHGAKIDRTHKKDNLTTAQVQRVLAAIDRDTLRGKRDYAIIALATTAGLRTVEIARANVEDVGNRGDDVVLYVQGKGRDGKNEYVKIAPEVETAIREYIAARPAHRKGDPLFASRKGERDDGGRMFTESISRIVKQRFRAVGIDSDRITAHSLRHTAATLNLMNGATLEETQQLMRHANITTTMIYNHAIDRTRNNSEARIAAAIFGKAA